MQQLVPKVQTLLDEFATTFEEPKGLPSSRGHEHQIVLKPVLSPFVKDLIGIPITKSLKLKLLLAICLSQVQLDVAKVHMHLLFC